MAFAYHIYPHLQPYAGQNNLTLDRVLRSKLYVKSCAAGIMKRRTLYVIIGTILKGEDLLKILLIFFHVVFFKRRQEKIQYLLILTKRINISEKEIPYEGNIEGRC